MNASLRVKGRLVGDGKVPLIISPLVGKTADAVLAELGQVLTKGPDIIEWRADHLADLGNQALVLDIARRIKAAAKTIPLLFTIRSPKEGGAKIPVTEAQVVDLHAAVCGDGYVDIVDFELSNPPEQVQQVRAVSRATDTTLVLSYHNFQSTPPLEVMTEKFMRAAEQEADIAKVAVMPTSPRDVLTLLTATLNASEKLNIPLISMSMGGYGSLSRLFGWVFGSAATFAVGAKSSAPGQVPIDDLRTVVEITRQAIAAKQ